MKKISRLTTVIFTTAMLASGASVITWADTKGWVEENGVWKYLDNSGWPITNEWKKSDTHYFWLDDNGEMATDEIIEDGNDKYYVDSNGARVVNQWKQEKNDIGWSNGDNGEPLNVWYYFGANGKAVTGKKTLNGKVYIFDEEGEMFTGWTHYLDKTYYLGEENEGAAYIGWHQLDLPEDLEDNYSDNEYLDGVFWFNFKNGGDMRASTEESKTERAYINGSYYGFDINGVMVTGWLPLGIRTATNSVYYREPTGNQPVGWMIAYPNEATNKESREPKWFYLNNKGIPFNAGGYYKDNSDSKSIGTALKFSGGVEVEWLRSSVATKSIDKKVYLFDNNGGMLYGVWYLDHVISVGLGKTLETGYYYFTDENVLSPKQGQMKKGKLDIECDGEIFPYYFDGDTGKAYTNMIIDGCLYKDNGVRVTAEGGKEVFVIESPDFTKDVTENKNKNIRLTEGTKVIVGTSGQLKKSGTVKVNGIKFSVKNYAATEVED